MSAMSLNPAWVGRHSCRKCGAKWHCDQKGCAGGNDTLLCLQCDAERAEVEVTNARKFQTECEEKKVRVDAARERLQSAIIHRDRLRAAVEEVYGGFSA